MEGLCKRISPQNMVLYEDPEIPIDISSGKLSQFAIEHGHLEIVDFPMKNGWFFHIVFCNL